MSTSWAQPSSLSSIPQSVADAALSILVNNPDAVAQPVAPVYHNHGPATSQLAHTLSGGPAPPSLTATTPGSDNAATIPLHTPSQPVLTPPKAATPPTLPCLLRYVDHDLMRRAADHNRPPNPKMTCSICSGDWDNGAVVSKNAAKYSNEPLALGSTFLPLWPCDHWVHYRCFIWCATRNSTQRDKCPNAACGRQLYVWEGITALTLATRTKLDMEDTGPDNVDLLAEATTIDDLIHVHFFIALSKHSPHTDGSPDLVTAFYDVVDALTRMRKPAAKWLQFTTQTGHYLYGSWVAIKMKRYLVEQHGKIQVTEGWVKYVTGMEALKKRIQDEVHKN